MLYSMTGYGKTENKNQNIRIIVEIKSLNNKGLDLTLKIPYWLKSIELDIRNIINEQLQRGKIDVYINVEILDNISLKHYNHNIIKNNFQQLKQLVQYLNINENNDYIQATLLREAMNTPDAYSITEEELLKDNNLQLILQTIIQCCEQVNNFRKTEGEKLEKDILNQIELLEKLKSKIKEIEPIRTEKIKNKILTSLKNNLDESKINNERLEQELIFYIEKLDINEELVRLESHLDYFKQTSKNGYNKGKKLIFIAQEIGREINTIGSKSNDENIQKLVVEMKDILEKIKEQLNNIL